MFRNFLFVYFMVTSIVSVLHVRVRMNAFPDGDVQMKLLVHLGDPKALTNFVHPKQVAALGAAQARQLDEILREDQQAALPNRMPASAVAASIKDK